MSRKEISAIFEKAQLSTSCHAKSIIALTKIYNKTPFDEFVAEFMRILLNIFYMPINKKNPFAERSLDFAANFTGKLVNQAAAEVTDANIEDLETHPFLGNIFNEVLKYHNLDLPCARYHSCQFITLVLKHTGDDVPLDTDICDTIQNAMLERIADCLSMVRIQAVMALLRLQDPTNNDCPVIQAYIIHLNDSNSRVRREVVERIAPAIVAIPKIVERVRDVDAFVRAAVFHKCAVIGPAFLRITDRQTILSCGFQEEVVMAKKAFLQVLLPKWITSYNGNFLKFINAIKLDADEADIKNWMSLSKNIMIEVLKEYPINEIIDFLPLNDNKLIPLDKLTSECISYWCILYDLLIKNPDLEEYVEKIVPELTHFSNYIEKFMKEKQNKLMEDWQYIEYQCILNLLLNMANNFDLSDEVGRVNLQKVIINTLTHNKVQFENVYTMVVILSKLITKPTELSNMVCQIISEIREPFVEQSEPTVSPENAFMIAGLKVKLNIATDDLEEAVKNSNYLLADQKNREIEELRNKLEEKVNEGTTVKVVQEDPDTVCRYLNILIALLQLPCIKKVDASLQTCKDEILLPLADCGNAEIFWRVHKCIGLFCLLDEDLAIDNFKTICTPLIMYRMLPNYNRSVLLTSVGLFADLLRMYGTKIIGGNDINSTFQKKNVRRLYQQNDVSDFDVHDLNSISCEEIIDIIVDVLDDDCQEVRECAGNSLSKLIIAGLLNSPTLISRIILKWFNPITEKNDQNLQQIFGICLNKYAETVIGSEEVLEKAVIPTLNAVANAPPTSPLADISVDNLVKFLCAITSITKKNQIINTHKNIAIALCSQLAKKPEHKCTDIWSRMLVNLNIPYKDSAAISELIKEVELLLENVPDKNARRYLERYLFNLKNARNKLETSKVALESIAEEMSENSDTNTQTSRSITNQGDKQGSGPKIVIHDVAIFHAKPTENVDKSGNSDGEPECKKKRVDDVEQVENVVSADSMDEEIGESGNEISKGDGNEKENDVNQKVAEEVLEKSLNSSNPSKNDTLNSSIEGVEESDDNLRKKIRLDDSCSSTKSKRGRKKKNQPESEVKTIIDARKNLVEGRRSVRIAHRTESNSSISRRRSKIVNNNKTKNNEKEKRRLTGRLSVSNAIASKPNSSNKKADVKSSELNNSIISESGSTTRSRRTINKNADLNNSTSSKAGSSKKENNKNADLNDSISKSEKLRSRGRPSHKRTELNDSIISKSDSIASSRRGNRSIELNNSETSNTASGRRRNRSIDLNNSVTSNTPSGRQGNRSNDLNNSVTSKSDSTTSKKGNKKTDLNDSITSKSSNITNSKKANTVMNNSTSLITDTTEGRRLSNRKTNLDSSDSMCLRGDVSANDSMSSRGTRTSLRNDKKIDYTDNLKVLLKRLDADSIIKGKAGGNNNIKSKVVKNDDNKSNGESKYNKKVPVPSSSASSTKSIITISSNNTKLSKNSVVPDRINLRSRRNDQITETDSSTTENETININNKREISKKLKRRGKKTKIDLNSSIDSLNGSPVREPRRSLRNSSSSSLSRSLPLKRKENKTLNYSMISNKSEETILHTFLQGDEFTCERIQQSILLSSESDSQSEVPIRKSLRKLSKK